MQNSTFLVLLRPIFAPKLKTPPRKRFGSRSCEGHAVIWTRIVEFFGSGAHPKSVKIFFFWRSLISARKSLCISAKTFFFLGDHLFFTKQSPQSNLRLMKIWVKFVYGCIKLQKKPPSPFAKSWQRAWIKQGSEKKFTLFTFEDPMLLV